MQTCKQKYPHILHTSTGVHAQTTKCIIQTQKIETHENLHQIRQRVLFAFRARKWYEVCWAPMCCAVKMQFRCVAFPEKRWRFVFHWRNLCWISVWVIHYSNQGRETRNTQSLLTYSMESFIWSLNYTSALRSHCSNAIGAKRVQQMIYNSA